MPERLPDPGEDLITAVVADEVRHDVPVDTATQHIAAVETGPEVARHRGKGLGFGAWLAIVWLTFLVAVALLAPVLPIEDPTTDANPSIGGQGPSADHLLGVDTRGRDMVSLLIWGARISLLIAVVSVTVGLVVGGAFGLTAGYFKGRIGSVLGSITDIFLAFPQLILALALVTFLGNEVIWVTLALTIVSIPVLARIARASALSWSEREFVTAARAQGAKHGRVMFREVLPNVLPAMFSIGLLGVAVVIVAEGGLAIIGAGVKLEVVTWGNILQSGSTELRNSPHIVLAPVAVIFFTVLSLNFLGDVVRARFDVREAGL